jgi:hypothetical protein
MQRKTIPTLIALMLLASCGGIGSDRTTVQGTGPGEFLKLRSGPGLGYSVVLGLHGATASPKSASSGVAYPSPVLHGFPVTCLRIIFRQVKT